MKIYEFQGIIRTIHKYILLAFVLFCSLSCECDEGIVLGSLDESYSVFDRFYGEYGGEGCIENFVLTDTKFFEDTNDKYSGTGFHFVKFENDEVENV